MTGGSRTSGAREAVTVPRYRRRRGPRRSPQAPRVPVAQRSRGRRQTVGSMLVRRPNRRVPYIGTPFQSNRTHRPAPLSNGTRRRHVPTSAKACADFGEPCSTCAANSRHTVCEAAGRASREMQPSAPHVHVRRLGLHDLGVAGPRLHGLACAIVDRLHATGDQPRVVSGQSLSG